MEPKTKITITEKKLSANLDPLMDKKVRAQYKLDSKKALVRSIKIGAWVAAVMAFLTLISWDFSNIENIFYLSFIVAFVSFVVLQARVQAKYKIPRTNHHTCNQFNLDAYNRLQRNFDDANSSLVGSKAWNATIRHD